MNLGGGASEGDPKEGVYLFGCWTQISTIFLQNRRLRLSLRLLKGIALKKLTGYSIIGSMFFVSLVNSHYLLSQTYLPVVLACLSGFNDDLVFVIGHHTR